jgi:hypothetical protein
MRQVRRMSSAVGLALFTLLALLLITPAAAAATADAVSPAVTPTTAHPEPMALASTGLNITAPVIVGITTLVLGIAVVAWAFLRTSSADQRR